MRLSGSRFSCRMPETDFSYLMHFATFKLLHASHGGLRPGGQAEFQVNRPGFLARIPYNRSKNVAR